MIRVPVIKVYDKDLKREHIVGTNHHDLLVTDGATISYQKEIICAVNLAMECIQEAEWESEVS